MKIATLVLFSLLVSCESMDMKDKTENFLQAENLNDFDCINKQADSAASLKDAQKWIVGKWRLKGIISMLPSNQVPDIELEFFEDGGVFVYKNGVNTYTDAYSIVEKTENSYSYLKLIGDNMILDHQETPIPRGVLRICEKELMIDQGMAFDAPAYLFRKE